MRSVIVETNVEILELIQVMKEIRDCLVQLVDSKNKEDGSNIL